jgi:hypothetical protein
MYLYLHVNYLTFRPILTELEFYGPILINSVQYKIRQKASRPLGAELYHADRHDEVIS